MRCRIGMLIICSMDWTSLLSDLKKRGWTQERIAKRVGTTQPTISGLASGEVKRGPTYEIGARLLSLHAEVMAEPTEAKA